MLGPLYESRSMHASSSSTEIPSSQHTERGAGLALLALAVGAFGIGTTEFGPMGMLPTIAGGVGVSIPAAGMLVSAYAAGVMAGAPVMSLLLARWPRRRALIALMPSSRSGTSCRRSPRSTPA